MAATLGATQPDAGQGTLRLKPVAGQTASPPHPAAVAAPIHFRCPGALPILIGKTRPTDERKPVTGAVTDKICLLDEVFPKYSGDLWRSRFSVRQERRCTMSGQGPISTHLHQPTLACRGTEAGVLPVARATPCFTPGTMIATHSGELPVEILRAGDKVITRDNGIQPIRWIGKSVMYAQDFQADPHLLPILIRQGALGRGLPERDLMVSPNHRILVPSERTSLVYKEREVLVAAKHLASAGVGAVTSSGTTYIHFMCDRHEVVLANGTWAETFHPEDTTLKGMGNAQRLEIFELFPELKTEEGRKAYPPARRVIGFLDRSPQAV